MGQLKHNRIRKREPPRTHLLRTRLHKARPFDVEELAMMMDLADPTRFGVRIGSHIEHDRIVPPRALPQLVENAVSRGPQ